MPFQITWLTFTQCFILFNIFILCFNLSYGFQPSACAGSIGVGSTSEGNLQIRPGTLVYAGYHFSLPDNHRTVNLKFYNLQVSFKVTCLNGWQTYFQFPMADSYNQINDCAWYPSADQNSPLVYQVVYTAPDMCQGDVMNLSPGVYVSGHVDSDTPTQSIYFQIHYGLSENVCWGPTTAIQVPCAVIMTPTTTPTFSPIRPTMIPTVATSTPTLSPSTSISGCGCWIGLGGTMEGNLLLTPGMIVYGGYHFTLPGNSKNVNLIIYNMQITYYVTCISSNSNTQYSFQFPIPSATYTAPDSQWYPSGDQGSPLVYQASFAVPDLCNGGSMSASNGVYFSGYVDSDTPTQSINFQMHYGNKYSTSWSATPTYKGTCPINVAPTAAPTSSKSPSYSPITPTFKSPSALPTKKPSRSPTTAIPSFPPTSMPSSCDQYFIYTYQTLYVDESPFDFCLDNYGNGYVSCSSHQVYKCSSGRYYAIAGKHNLVDPGLVGYTNGDGGDATSALFTRPQGIVRDPNGNMYICDQIGNKIRVVDSRGIINSYGGVSGVYGFSGDGGNAKSATFAKPTGICTDNAGLNIYVSDCENHRIRQISLSTQIVTTVAGTGVGPAPGGFSGDGGAATNCQLNQPHGVAMDTVGNMYIADTLNHRIRVVTSGQITTCVGNGIPSFLDGVAATSGGLNNPTGIYVDMVGCLYIADTGNNMIRKVNFGSGQTAIISTIAGSLSHGGQFYGDGSYAQLAGLNAPCCVKGDSNGNLYICDLNNKRIRVLKRVCAPTSLPTLKPTVTNTVASTTLKPVNTPTQYPTYRTPTSTPTICTTQYIFTYITLNGNGNPHDFCFDNYGNPFTSCSSHQIYICQNNGGQYWPVAGYYNQPAGGFNGDGGFASNSYLNNPYGATFDRSGNMYFTDQNSNRIRCVNSAGFISTIGGSFGWYGFFGDGWPANYATFARPSGLCIDVTGKYLYVADTDNHRVRSINLNNKVVATVAGGGYAPLPGGYRGDGGYATNCALNSPSGLATDSSGNLYIADTNNHRIRVVSLTSGIISTCAGSGTNSYVDGVAATTGCLSRPSGVYIDPKGCLFIADTGNHMIRKVDLTLGLNAIITTIVGSASYGGQFFGDGGHAQLAGLSSPCCIKGDNNGNLYICDQNNQRIRVVKTQCPSVPTFTPTALPIPTPVPTVPVTNKPSAAPTVRLNAPLPPVPTPAPSSVPTAAPTGPLWILGFTTQTCTQVCSMSSSGVCLQSFLSTITSEPAFMDMLNQSVFAGSCQSVGVNVNNILNPLQATTQSYCSDINYVNELATDPMAYTYQSVVMGDGKTALNISATAPQISYTYLTRCGFPTSPAQATGTCDSQYFYTQFSVQRWCPCSGTCMPDPNGIFD